MSDLITRYDKRKSRREENCEHQDKKRKKLDNANNSPILMYI